MNARGASDRWNFERDVQLVERGGQTLAGETQITRSSGVDGTSKLTFIEAIKPNGSISKQRRQPLRSRGIEQAV